MTMNRSEAARAQWRKRKENQFILVLANMDTSALLTIGPFKDKPAAHKYAKREYPNKPWRYNVTPLRQPQP